MGWSQDCCRASICRSCTPASFAALWSMATNFSSVAKWEQEQVARYPPRGSSRMAR